jgi:hypothetical protein
VGVLRSYVKKAKTEQGKGKKGGRNDEDSD